MCGTPLRTDSPQEVRKTVTVLFCDLVGSTALGERLDPETLRAVIEHYFDEMRGVLEHHGGLVEKYIGDAIMAVFGLPRAHEDDALRAVRAATDMAAALSGLNLELEGRWGVTLSNRTGVNTGEVVVGDSSSGQRLATGDAVNVAARLEQAAGADEVLIGDPTYRLVRHGVDVVAVEPLALKGKSERLPAHRLIGVSDAAEGVASGREAALVGRASEVGLLINAFEKATRERTCHLVTVEGEAGVGKSRLVREVVHRLQPKASLLSGRCLSYGEGITFWPLVEIVRQAADIGEADSVEGARHKLLEVVGAEHEDVADRVGSLVGLSTNSFPLEESFRATRELLKILSGKHPLIVVVEDIHWAEPTWLDLVEHVASVESKAACLIICTSRLELRQSRPDWIGARSNSFFLRLDPLSDKQSGALIDALLGEVDTEVHSRVTAAAQGNPLYVEQIISMWIDEGLVARDNGRWVSAGQIPASIPPTISALLSARLDGLHPEDRSVIGAASVIGQIFYRRAVEELISAELSAQIPDRLATLTTKELIQPDESTFAGERAFSFRHVLIRDAAYERLLKRTRAELHERFASWLEEVTGERANEYEEILGYHLEQAYRYLETLGPVADKERFLAARAGQYLSSAGRRAMSLGDLSAAVKLLDRAQALLPRSGAPRIELLCDLGESRRLIGQTGEATALLTTAAQLARSKGERRLQMKAELNLINIKVDEGGAPLAELQAGTEEAVHVLSDLGPSEELSHATALLGGIHMRRGEMRKSALRCEEAAELGRRGGSIFAETQSRKDVLVSMCLGPHHAEEVLARGRRELDWARSRSALRLEATALWAMATAEAMRDRFGDADELLQEIDSLTQRLTLETVVGESFAEGSGVVDLLLGKPERAEKRLRPICELLERAGLAAYLHTSYPLLGESLYAQGNWEEAERIARRVQQMATLEDAQGEIRWRKLLGKVLAQRGQGGAAHARAAVKIAESTDMLNLTGDALSDLAYVLSAMDHREQAITNLEHAVALYAKKGNLASESSTRRSLEENAFPGR